MSALFEQIAENLIDGQSKKVKELVEKAIEEGHEAKEILNEGLLAGMNEVGVLFKEGELFVPEVLVAAKAMNTGMEVLAPHLKEGDVTKSGKIIMATVAGDLHDIGVNLVGMMMEGAGYEVINIGVDASPEKIVESVKEHQPDIIGMSAMLTTTMASMKDTVDALKEAGLSDSVKIMIGGSPVSDRYAKEIGVNYAADATAAVELANQMMGRA